MGHPDPAEPSFIERLPDELLLAIFDRCSQIPVDRQKILLTIASVSSRLSSIAQECLFARPYLRVDRIDQIVPIYKRRPELAAKATTMEIASHLTAAQCTCGHQDRSLQQIVELFELLPRLHTILLGPTYHQNTLSLESLLLGPGELLCGKHGYLIENTTSAEASRTPKTYAQVLQRLRILELPTEWRYNQMLADRGVFKTEWDLSICTSLKELVAPQGALFTGGDPNFRFLGSLPQSLEKLTLTTTLNVNLASLMRSLVVHIPRTALPRLQAIEIWSLSRDPDPSISPPKLFPRLEDEGKVVSECCAQLTALGMSTLIHYENDHCGFIMGQVSKERGEVLDKGAYLGLEPRGIFEKWILAANENDRRVQGKGLQWFEAKEKRRREWNRKKREARGVARELIDSGCDSDSGSEDG